MRVSMTAAYARLPKKGTIPTIRHHVVSQDDIMYYLYMVITISPNAFFKDDKLDTDRLASQAMNRLNCDDSELIEACVKTFAEAVGRAEAKEEGSDMSFKTALASEIF